MPNPTVPAAAPGLPNLDFAQVWDILSPNVQAEIGRLVIQEAFLRFAAGEYEGDDGERVVYLEDESRAAVDEAAESTADMLRGVIEGHLPELFGENPSPAHPKGTDPAWAAPIKGGANGCAA